VPTVQLRAAAAALTLVIGFGPLHTAALESAPGPQGQQPASPRTKPARKPRVGTFEEFQVAAGNTLPIELRSRLTSNGNQAADHVEGRLLRAIVADGVELVPAGATVLGTISEAEAAGLKKPGRLSFTFHVIEHPDTGSRATIKGSLVSFESQRPAKGNVYPDVVLEKGTDASVLLLAPLLVRLPVQ
jgi:hypothetical protein